MWTVANLNPGVYKDDSPLKAIGYWIDADKMRFVGGIPETIYGWEKASTTQLLGICRGAFTWQDNGRSAWAAFGTHLRLYAMDLDGAVTDITPVSTYSLSNMSVSTTDTSATVTITGWTHGLVVDQKFALANSTVTDVGGVTIDGTYVVLEVLSATSITFTAAQTATSTAGPTALTVNVSAYLAPGQQDGLAGAGYGTGGYGSGGYGGGSSGLTLYPRTWSFDQWGQNLLASPRGGGLYEWGPNAVSGNLITQNASFTAATGWTAGAGLSIGGGQALASAGTASDLTQNITTQAGIWNLLAFNLTVTAGTIGAYYNNLTIGTATSTGNYRLPFLGDGSTAALRFSKTATFAGVIRNASVTALSTGVIVPGAPTQIGSMFVSAERAVVACGSNLDGPGTGTTDFDPLQIDWSDQENNQLWAPASSNYAGGFTLPSGGRIVRGMPGVRENLIWTVEGLWAMRYNGNPGSVYDFIEMGRGCGLIGPNAACLVGGIWHWMTPTGAFYRYAGGVPSPVPCSIARDVFDNLAWVQQDKVYASRVVGKNYAEAWWFYPDMRDDNGENIECSRYAMLGTAEPGLPWAPGNFDRTAYVDSSVFQFPMAVDTDGYIWFHEKGFTEDGGTRSAYIVGAFNTNVKGEIVINGVRPDGDDIQGGFTYTFTSKTRSVRGISTREYPALTMNSSTGERSCRVKGEQVGFRVDVSGLPSFWRQGLTQFNSINIGATR